MSNGFDGLKNVSAYDFFYAILNDLDSAAELYATLSAVEQENAFASFKDGDTDSGFKSASLSESYLAHAAALEGAKEVVVNAADECLSASDASSSIKGGFK